VNPVSKVCAISLFMAAFSADVDLTLIRGTSVV